jgi:hypothetical protein
MSIEYTLDADDVASARLLAIGIRPRLEFSLFAAVIAAELAISVSPLSFGLLPLLAPLTACLGAFRLTQIYKIKAAAVAAFKRNSTLRSPTVAVWDAEGVTISPATAPSERIPWLSLQPVKENERVILFQQARGQIHAVPKRAFAERAELHAFRQLARVKTRARRPSKTNP